MGIWSGLSKIVQGKPVFETPEQQEGMGEPAEGTGEPSAVTAISSNGHKIIPEVSLEHCESHVNGSEMDVTVWATNRSTEEVELDKIEMLGMTMELDRFLEPNEAHQLFLYKGKVPTNDSYHTAHLYYKQVDSGDYFCADFTIKYTYDSHGFYMVEELHPVRPVRDV